MKKRYVKELFNLENNMEVIVTFTKEECQQKAVCDFLSWLKEYPDKVSLDRIKVYDVEILCGIVGSRPYIVKVDG